MKEEFDDKTIKELQAAAENASLLLMEDWNGEKLHYYSDFGNV